MKKHGIIFQDWSVRAIIEGRKTQTRLVIKPQPDNRMTEPLVWKCPYGQVGDLLWVRCAWREMGSAQRADSKQPPPEMLKKDNVVFRFEHPEEGHWRSPLFMPYRISPVVLPITGQKVERVQDISNWDAVSEGCPPPSGTMWATMNLPRMWFRHKWNSIHGPGAWDRNDWVCVLEWSEVQRRNGIPLNQVDAL